MRLRGNQRTTRALNRRLVLNELRRNGPLSRAEIAGEIGLSPAAVTFVTSELLDQGLLLEGPAVAASSGRRPVPLAINYPARLSIGVKVSADRVEGVVTDLATRPLQSAELAIADTRPEAVVQVTSELVASLLEGARAPSRRLIGVGLIISGQVDAEKGVARQMQRFGWRDVPIAAMLADALGVPVWIDNDANSFAVSQFLFGPGQGASSLLGIAIGRGIGAGLILEGRLYRGASGAAGEFGHGFEERGRTCECGRDGCLEAYCADAGLLQTWQALAPEVDATTPEALMDAANAGDAIARQVLREAGTRLGHHVANLVNMVDPEIIVFGGEGVRFGDHLFSSLRQVLAEASYPGVPRIEIDDGHTGWPEGAAALAINHFFNFEATGGYEPTQNIGAMFDEVA